MQDWLLERKAKGSYGGLFAGLVLQSKTFKQYLKVPLPTFQFLLAKVRPWKGRQDTHLRAAITVGARLEATLLYLITGLKYSQLQFPTRISAASLGHIIPETCHALYLSLKNEYLKVSVSIVALCQLVCMIKKTT